MKKDKLAELSKWFKIFFLATAIIVVYKTFDNIGNILGWFGFLLSLLTPFFIGFVLAFFLNRPVGFLQKKFSCCKVRIVQRISKFLSIFIVYVIFLALLGIILGSLLPMLISSISDFVGHLPEYISAIKENIQRLEEANPNLAELGIFEMINDISGDKIIAMMNIFDMENIKKYLDGVMSVSNALLNSLIGFIVSIYMILEKDMLLGFVKRVCRLFMNERKFETAKSYVQKSNFIIFRYFLGQFCDSLLISICASIILMVLNVPYGIVLGFLFGMFNLIPYFGPIIMGVVVVLITFLSSGFFTALWAAILLLAIQQIDANIINPKILGTALDISPFWVIFSVTVGSGLFGLLGMLFSVPVFAVFRLIILNLIEVREKHKAEKNSGQVDGDRTDGEPPSPVPEHTIEASQKEAGPSQSEDTKVKVNDNMKEEQ